MENIRKVFALYVTFPKSRWKEIKKAERDSILYNKLMNEYKTKQLFNRKNRKYSDNLNHQNISAHEIFINDEDAVVI